MTTIADAVHALKLIAEGYTAKGDGLGEFVQVENPAYQPDNGHDPYIVVDVAALTAQQGGVRVKAWEWTQIRENHWRADTAFGPWEVCNQPMFGRPWRTFSPPGWKTYHGDDPEELKRLSQQEVSQRILSSLEASPRDDIEGRVDIIEQSETPDGGTALTLRQYDQETVAVVYFPRSSGHANPLL